MSARWCNALTVLIIAGIDKRRRIVSANSGAKSSDDNIAGK